MIDLVFAFVLVGKIMSGAITLLLIVSLMEKIRMLTLIDECTRKCLAVEVRYQLNSPGILDILKEAFI